MNSSEHIKGTLLSFFEPEVAASMVMLTFVSYETKGLFGHYRTVINQLLSYAYGAVSIEKFPIMMNV